MHGRDGSAVVTGTLVFFNDFDLKMNREIIPTADGSATILVKSEKFPDGITYHSSHGALQESMHVFIRAGLHAMLEEMKLETTHAAIPAIPEKHILEIGLGTCLNAMLSALAISEEKMLLHYDGVEAFPLEDHYSAQSLGYYRELYKAFDLPASATAQEAEFLHQRLLDALWITQNHLNHTLPGTSINERFALRKFQTSVQDMQLENDFYDCVYFDAFAPTAQPELWEEEVFGKIFKSMKPGSMLVTYCAKGSVRRLMEGIGFRIEKLQGPAGKREMVRAWK